MVPIPALPLSHQHLMVTMFGLYSQSDGGVLPVSFLVAMFEELGYAGQSARAAISRFKARGLLVSVDVDGRAGYRLCDELRETVLPDDPRIFSLSGRPDPSNSWLLAIFSVPETMRKLRHQIRRELTAMGFATTSAGVWIATPEVLDQTRQRLREHELDKFVDFFQGTFLVEGSLRSRVAEWWDLEKMHEQFSEFLDIYGDAVDLWSEELGADPKVALACSSEAQRRDCFRYYIPMLTFWRRFPYHAPSLPDDVLPKDWKSKAARQVFVRTHNLIGPLAALHAQSLRQSATSIH